MYVGASMTAEQTPEGPVPEVVRNMIFALQLCVPKDWTDEAIIEFGNFEAPGATWVIRRTEEYKDAGNDDLERMPCEDKDDFVHVVLQMEALVKLSKLLPQEDSDAIP